MADRACSQIKSLYFCKRNFFDILQYCFFIISSQFFMIFSLSYFYNCTKNSKSVSCLDFFYQEVTNSVTSLYMKFGIRNPEFGICYSFSNHGNYLLFVSEYLFSYSSTSNFQSCLKKKQISSFAFRASSPLQSRLLSARLLSVIAKKSRIIIDFRTATLLSCFHIRCASSS